MHKRYIVALEIASSKIKGAIASLPIEQNGAEATASTITIEAIEEAPTTAEAIQYGRIVNITETAKTASMIIQRLENRKIFSPGKIVTVYSSIEGRSLASEHISTELEFPAPTDITSEFVDRLKKAACAQVDKNREVLAVIPLKYMVDSTLTVNPVGVFGQKLSGAFTIVTCNPINKRNLEMVVEDRLKLNICENIVCPLAEAELVLTNDERQIGCALIDLGSETTTVAIYKNSVLQHISTLPLGARNITRDISMGVGITEERAEQLKCTIGNAIDENPGNVPGSEEAKVNSYVRARIGEIVANISAQISAADFKGEDLPGGFVVVGGGARLRNFNILLENATKLKVRTGTCGSDFRIADSSIDHYNNIDILSIVNTAARTSDYVCIEMPFESGVDTTPETKPTRTYEDKANSIDDNDPTLLIDDEKIDIINRQNEEKKKHPTIKTDAPLDGPDDTEDADGNGNKTEGPNKLKIIQSFKDKIVRIFTVDDDQDALLDDDQDAKV